MHGCLSFVYASIRMRHHLTTRGAVKGRRLEVSRRSSSKYYYYNYYYYLDPTTRLSVVPFERLKHAVVRWAPLVQFACERDVHRDSRRVNPSRVSRRSIIRGHGYTSGNTRRVTGASRRVSRAMVMVTAVLTVAENMERRRSRCSPRVATIDGDRPARAG